MDAIAIVVLVVLPLGKRAVECSVVQCEAFFPAAERKALGKQLAAAAKNARREVPEGGRAYGIITCGAAVGSAEWKAHYLREKGKEVCNVAQRVTRALLEEDAQCAQTALYWSLQCRIDYYMAVHLP